MPASKKVFGTVGTINVYRTKRDKLIKVEYDGIEFFSKAEVVERQKAVHKQLTLLTESIQKGVQDRMLPILHDEAKLLRDRLIDLRSVKEIFSGKG